MYRKQLAFAALIGLQASAFNAVAQCTAANANPRTAESTPTSAFTSNGDGTVTHNLTGLMWKQCSQGQSGPGCATGSATTSNWAGALAAAVSDTTAGYGDWRLPNKKELESLVETCGSGPSINQSLFPSTPGTYYWTSSSYVGEPANAWYVQFGTGNTSNYLKPSAFAARLVRGGRGADTFDTAARQTVVEYLDTADFPNSPGGHYFYSSEPAEQDAVDAGAAGQFARTGRHYLTGGSRPVCRFYGSVSPGPNSHFFTVDMGECNALKAAQVSPAPANVQQWNYEGIGYSTTPPTIAANGERSCPAGTLPQYRAYNNAYPASGPKNPWDSNHRFVGQLSDMAEMVAAGWRDEGIVFCSGQ